MTNKSWDNMLYVLFCVPSEENVHRARLLLVKFSQKAAFSASCQFGFKKLFETF